MYGCIFIYSGIKIKLRKILNICLQDNKMLDLSALLIPVLTILSVMATIYYVEKSAEELRTEIIRDHKRNYCS